MKKSRVPKFPDLSASATGRPFDDFDIATVQGTPGSISGPDAQLKQSPGDFRQRRFDQAARLRGAKLCLNGLDLFGRRGGVNQYRPLVHSAGSPIERRTDHIAAACQLKGIDPKGRMRLAHSRYLPLRGD